MENTFAADGYSDKALNKRIASILKKTPLIDGHNDLPMQYTMRVQGNLDQMPFTSDLSASRNQLKQIIPECSKA